MHITLHCISIHTTHCTNSSIKAIIDSLLLLAISATHFIDTIFLFHEDRMKWNNIKFPDREMMVVDRKKTWNLQGEKEKEEEKRKTKVELENNTVIRNNKECNNTKYEWKEEDMKRIRRKSENEGKEEGYGKDSRFHFPQF
ncbi:hypothetical protein LOAG_10598 [Loa loa]|uniref:Uncharacterized protein n=1 Tax=Loa loa TaxID=7209 RepID=A0A1S0TQT5_LOALO|nr:hypothetical protein LOAG_10598 [Loa loa]EFO17900.1 hypothetical protein LOAG_10598 [Loa loa]